MSTKYYTVKIYYLSSYQWESFAFDNRGLKSLIIKEHAPHSDNYINKRKCVHFYSPHPPSSTFLIREKEARSYVEKVHQYSTTIA